ncbi:hypothetical protein HY004_02370 [Candidatus Saccharibacteria bacterium]|nr:hypothetical protein [Candidatus Saccharibacteria bacterium]
MPEIELSIENPYATHNLRHNREPTAFARAFRHLSLGLNPGKVVPVFMHIDNDHKLFGIFTLNKGGSVSFFPDFYKLNNFDHITLSKDFIKNKGHLTKVSEAGKHSKSISIEASLLSNGNYHLVTFGMEDGGLLMDSPPQIELPPVTYNSEEEQKRYHAWIEQAVDCGISILYFPKELGFYCVQIIVSPKGHSGQGMSVVTNFIQRLLVDSEVIDSNQRNCQVVTIPTTENCDFMLHILTFRVNNKLSTPFGISMARTI